MNWLGIRTMERWLLYGALAYNSSQARLNRPIIVYVVIYLQNWKCAISGPRPSRCSMHIQYAYNFELFRSVSVRFYQFYFAITLALWMQPIPPCPINRMDRYLITHTIDILTIYFLLNFRYNNHHFLIKTEMTKQIKISDCPTLCHNGWISHESEMRCTVN